MEQDKVEKLKDRIINDCEPQANIADKRIVYELTHYKVDKDVHDDDSSCSEDEKEERSSGYRVQNWSEMVDGRYVYNDIDGPSIGRASDMHLINL